jgi:hypothetical protein
MTEQFPANELEEGLVAASQGRRTVQSWLEDLAQAKVWVPLDRSDDDDSGTMRTITLDAKPYVPVFTSRHQLESTLGAAPMVNPPMNDFVTYLPEGVGVAINPGGDLGMPLEAAAVQQLQGQPHTVKAETSVMLGDPAVEPVDFLGRVAALLQDVPGAKAARRCWAAVGSQPPGLVLSVDLVQVDDDQRQEVVTAIATAVENAALDYSVDVVFDADASEFTGWMLANTTPFFTGFTL